MIQLRLIKLRIKKLLGSISHLARDEYIDYLAKSINKPSVGNQSDFLLATGKAATAIVDAKIKDHKLYITIETLPTEAGVILAKMFKDDFDIPVSMSTKLNVVNGKYIIKEIFGLDITFGPAFKSYSVKKEVIE